MRVSAKKKRGRIPHGIILLLVGIAVMGACFVLLTVTKPETSASLRLPSLIEVAEREIYWKKDVREVEKVAIRSRYSTILGIIQDIRGGCRRAWKLWDDGAYHKAVAGTRVPPDYLMAITLLESQADPTKVSPAGAAGIAQFMPKVARSKKLGLRVDDKVDERFNVEKSLAASARLLQELLGRYGQLDWMVQGYHMGQPRADKAIRRYTDWLTYATHPMPDIIAGKTRYGPISVTRVMLDATPDRHPKTSRHIYVECSDYTWEYSWKVIACRDLLQMWRYDRAQFDRLYRIYGTKQPTFPRAVALRDEVVYYQNAEMFRTDESVRKAYLEGHLVEFPNGEERAKKYGIIRGKTNSYAKPGDQRYFQSATPETVGMAYLAAAYYKSWTRGKGKPLQVTSLVRSDDYLRRMIKAMKQSRVPVSCHCLGRSVDFSLAVRRPDIFERVLWRMKYMGWITWKKEVDHYHVTVLPRGCDTGKQVYLAMMYGAQPAPPNYWWLWEWAVIALKWGAIIWPVGTAIMWFLLRREPRMRRNPRLRRQFALTWPLLPLRLLKAIFVSWRS